LIEQSTFVNWQKIHVQENANEIPPGSIPRSVDIIVRNDLVEKAKPGDKCDFTGCLIVVPDVTQLAIPSGQMVSSSDGRAKDGFAHEGITGLKELGARELTYKLAFMACMVQATDSRNMGGNNSGEFTEELEEIFTPRDREDILRIKETPQLYQRLVESIAPSIYGHSDVKSGIALMLFGGVHKTTPEGIRLRGDINVCVVGDPGTAKSQFLKYVVGFLPRSVYTSGKASSAAGLTASVVKDEETGEFTIEAGALMLADNVRRRLFS
jgi:DNA replication licensing factor MCM6